MLFNNDISNDPVCYCLAQEQSSYTSSVSQGSKVLQNDEFTKDLFRFLQLLCEGHNGGKNIDRLLFTFSSIHIIQVLALNVSFCLVIKFRLHFCFIAVNNTVSF